MTDVIPGSSKQTCCISKTQKDRANCKRKEARKMVNYHYKKNILLVYGFNNRIADCRTISAPCHNNRKFLNRKDKQNTSYVHVHFINIWNSKNKHQE